MNITLHPHCIERMFERGTTREEIIQTVEEGEQFQAKYNRIGFRHHFEYNKEWNGKSYKTKLLEIIALPAKNELIIVAVIIKYY